MKSLIEEIYGFTFSDIKEDYVSTRDSTRKIEEFMRRLEPSMREVFVNLVEQEVQAASAKNVDVFRKGFQMGIQLMVEVFGSFAIGTPSK